jgi:Carboxypeptidase regulatory-like domain
MRKGQAFMSRHFLIRFVVAMGAALAASIPGTAQDFHAPGPRLGMIVGTVVDVNGDTISGATVVLRGLDRNNGRVLVTSENGFFSFQGVNPGIPYQIIVSAKDFAEWKSATITLEPSQYKIIPGIQLRLEAAHTTVDVHYDPVQVATEQIRLEEKQRVFGVIPNFYVSYDQNAEALTPKMKFGLALKVAGDPVTATGVLFVAAAKQAGNSPKFGQGWDAFGKRISVTAADGFTDIMIGGAILPSLLHQDPRYFYQGTGTNSSRIRHAVLSPFVSRNDNGSWGPNYSTVGGVLASSALANLYYPRANRGAGLVFGNFAIGMAERIGGSLAQEFLLGRFTKRGGHVN